MKLEAGGFYEVDRGHGGMRYLCLEECQATTVRFNRPSPGYRLLVTESWGSGQLDEGETLVVPVGANITTRAKRLG